MKRETKRRNNKGFSLVELIIVIAIMAILAGILAPQFIKYIKKSRVSTDIQNAQQIATAISAEYADAGEETTVGFVVINDTTGAAGWKTGTANAEAGNRALKDVLGGVPKVKAESGKYFAYSVETGGTVKVSVVDSDASGHSTDVLYPTQPTTGTWAQK